VRLVSGPLPLLSSDSLTCRAKVGVQESKSRSRRTQPATPANSRSLRSPRALYREHFADARRERLFLSSVAFFLTFAIVRAITYAVHAQITARRRFVTAPRAQCSPAAVRNFAAADYIAGVDTCSGQKHDPESNGRRSSATLGLS
jgi:hypothetical protein